MISHRKSRKVFIMNSLVGLLLAQIFGMLTEIGPKSFNALFLDSALKISPAILWDYYPYSRKEIYKALSGVALFQLGPQNSLTSFLESALRITLKVIFKYFQIKLYLIPFLAHEHFEFVLYASIKYVIEIWHTVGRL